MEQYVDSGSARYRDYQDISERKGSCLIFFAAFLSLFWPTSVGGVIVSYLPIVSILLSCFLLLIYSVGGKFIAVNVFVFCFFFLLLLFFYNNISVSRVYFWRHFSLFGNGRGSYDFAFY